MVPVPIDPYTKEFTKLVADQSCRGGLQDQIPDRAGWCPECCSPVGKKLKTLGESMTASLIEEALLAGAAPSEVAPNARRILAMNKMGSRK